MHKEPSVLASWVLAIDRTIQSYGVDPTPLLKKAGIDPGLLRQHEARIPYSKSNQLWHLSAIACNDPLIGLRVPEYITFNSLYALDAAAQCASTMREMLYILCRFSKVATTAVEVSVESDDHVGRLVFKNVTNTTLCDQGVDAFMSIVCSTIKTVLRRIESSESFFRQLDVMRPAPADFSAYQSHFGCEVQFNKPFCCIHFNTKMLEIPLPESNPRLSQMTEELLRGYLSRIQDQDIEMKARAIILELLSLQKLNKANVASRLNMSVRNLTRKLSEADITFSQLVNSIRQEKAIHLIKQSHISIGEIAFELGFDDVNSFIRAFRKWTGVTPGKYRSELTVGSRDEDKSSDIIIVRKETNAPLS